MMDLTKIPSHIAIILDGNGRWAKKRGRPRIYGHRKGAFNIEKIAKHANDLGVKVLSIYCFSTENWTRPEGEVSYLMTLPIRYFNRYFNKIKESPYKIRFSGRRDRINQKLQDLMQELEEVTNNHEGLILNICFDYGSRDEIIRGIKKLYTDLSNNKIKALDVTPELFDTYLDTAYLGDVDLLIRTSGEERISNFLLWQIAYAELYFTDVLWPDFDEIELDKAIISYSKRNRRFGGLKEQEK